MTITVPVRTPKEDRTRTEAARGDTHPATPVDRQVDETPEAWLARLQTVSQEGMTMFLRFNYLHRKEEAERLVKEAGRAGK